MSTLPNGRPHSTSVGLPSAPHPGLADGAPTVHAVEQYLYFVRRHYAPHERTHVVAEFIAQPPGAVILAPHCLPRLIVSRRSSLPIRPPPSAVREAAPQPPPRPFLAWGRKLPDPDSTHSIPCRFVSPG
eukprot:3986374-Prymnesium_polylepis.2